MKVAIIGYGVVGSGVYEILKKNAKGIARRAGLELEVGYVLDIRDFPDHPEKEIFVKDFNIILNDPDVSVVVETMGGIRFAYEYTKAALESGKSVVTSNKELVAAHGHEFFALAEEHGCRYLYEASVGGGIPIIRPLAHCLAGNEIESVSGIINGTTNYILTKMFKNGQTYESALKEAQELGYAEKDPTADVDGHDVCRKISILASLCLGKRVDSNNVPTAGIRSITVEDVSYAAILSSSIKLVGYASFKDGKAGVFVSPMMIPKCNPLAGIDYVNNGIMVKGNMVGECMFYGPGAGKLPTASAVVGDIIDIAKNSAYIPEFAWTVPDEPATFDPAEIESKFFVRVRPRGEDAVRAEFGDVKFISGVSDVGFVTDVMSEKEIDRRLKKVSGFVSKIRMYQ
ncbi:MAG: homoserine dehydrogenase [Oscillospiraceae bacterium]|nr:homoserine dehydrogenase [Oscillospiraceae bacterium]